jgi:hypothetical protein
MTEEAEKAAKWDMLQELKRKKSHLAVLRDSLEKTGKSLQKFGLLLINPLWLFRREKEGIAGNHTTLSGPDCHFEIPLAHLNVEHITELLQDVAGTQEEIHALEERLREMS